MKRLLDANFPGSAVLSQPWFSGVGVSNAAFTVSVRPQGGLLFDMPAANTTGADALSVTVGATLPASSAGDNTQIQPTDVDITVSFEYSVAFTNLNQNFDIRWRNIDGNNFYYCRFNYNDGFLRVGRVVGGTQTQLAAVFQAYWVSNFTIRILSVGETILVHTDEVLDRHGPDYWQIVLQTSAAYAPYPGAARSSGGAVRFYHWTSGGPVGANDQIVITRLIIDDLGQYPRYLRQQPPVETLVDQFTTGLDRQRWLFSSGAGQTDWDAANQRAQIACTSGYYALATDLNNPAFSLEGSGLLAKVTPPPAGTAREFYMEFITSAVRNNKVTMLTFASTLIAQQTIGGSNTQYATRTFNPATDVWWRIRNSGTTIYFETSPDGITWNLFTTAPTSFDISQGGVVFTSGSGAGDPTANAYVDNVNAPPVVLGQAQSDGTSSFTGQLGLLRPLSGSSAGVATATGTLRVSEVLAAISAGVGNFTAIDMRVSGPLRGQSDGHGNFFASPNMRIAQTSQPGALVQFWDGDAWTNLYSLPVCDVRSIVIDRGRSTFLDAFAAGTCTLVMANTGSFWSAWNPYGFWMQNGDFVTDVPIRIGITGTQFTDAGVQFYKPFWLFMGYTDSVVDSWPDATDNSAQVVIQCTDGFKHLARHNGGVRTAVGSGELSGARVHRFLDDAGVPSVGDTLLPTPRRVDTGLVHLQATDLNGPTLDLMRTVGESEWGWLYCDEQGGIVFKQRDALQTDPRMTDVQWYFGDRDGYGPQWVCYGDLKLAADDSTIVNQAQITPPGQPTAVATDAASIDHFQRRTWTRTDLPISTNAEALGTAQVIVLEYAKDDKRVEALTFDAMHHGAYPVLAAQGVQINDRIRVSRTLPGVFSLSGPAPVPQLIDVELLVQGIRHEILPKGERLIGGGPSSIHHIGSWTVTLKTAGAALSHDFGRWDTPPGGPPATAGWDVSRWAL